MRWWMLTNAPSSVFSPFGRKSCRCGTAASTLGGKSQAVWLFSYASRPAVGEGFLTRRFYSGNAVNHSEITGEGGGGSRNALTPEKPLSYK